MKKLLLIMILLCAGLAFAQTAHRVDLTWNASTDVTAGLGYNVYRTQTAGTGYVKLNLAPIVGLAFSDSGVAIGQTYFYIARSSLNGLESVNSNEATARILPAPPTSLQADSK